MEEDRNVGKNEREETEAKTAGAEDDKSADISEENEEMGKTPSDDGKLEFRGIGNTRLENFWYYHKWKVIIGAFFAVVIGVCIYQFIDRDVPDIYIMYAGPQYLSSGAGGSVREAFCAVIDDYNGDGERGLGFVSLTCMTEEQIEHLESQYHAESEDFVIDKQANGDNIKKFDMEIFGGESVICMLDPSLYERVREAGGLEQIDDIFTEEELEGVELYDSTGIVLGSLRFAKYYSGVGSLPDDTVLCIRKISTISFFKGREKYEAMHDDHIDAFRRLVLFEYPEGYVPPEETSGGGGAETK